MQKQKHLALKLKVMYFHQIEGVEFIYDSHRETFDVEIRNWD